MMVNGVSGRGGKVIAGVWGEGGGEGSEGVDSKDEVQAIDYCIPYFLMVK